MKDYLLRLLCFSAAMIVLIIGINFIYAQTSSPSEQAAVGRVVWVKGSFKAMLPDKKERTLEKTSPIYENDTLITGKDSQAQIVFTDNTLMTFRQDTTFMIDEYSFTRKPKEEESTGKYIMKLIKGGFRTITGLIARNHPDDYQINTPVATIGVRGTDYSVYFADGKTYLEFISGQPCITSAAKQLCLNNQNRYAVSGKDVQPVVLTQQPAVFSERLDVIPAQISQSTQPGSRRDGGSSGNFCIVE